MADEIEVTAEVIKAEDIAPKKRAKSATAKYEVINGAISPNGGGMGGAGLRVGLPRRVAFPFVPIPRVGWVSRHRE